MLLLSLLDYHDMVYNPNASAKICTVHYMNGLVLKNFWHSVCNSVLLAWQEREWSDAIKNSIIRGTWRRWEVIFACQQGTLPSNEKPLEWKHNRHRKGFEKYSNWKIGTGTVHQPLRYPEVITSLCQRYKMSPFKAFPLSFRLSTLNRPKDRRLASLELYFWFLFWKASFRPGFKICFSSQQTKEHYNKPQILTLRIWVLEYWWLHPWKVH